MTLVDSTHSNSAGRDLLVLWDIDHTLIETKGVGTQLFGAAFAQVTDHDMRKVVQADGRTESQVFNDTTRLHGIPASDEMFAGFETELVASHERERAWLAKQGCVLPGALEAPTLLAARPGIAQSVVTGNVRGVAAAKLRAYQLDVFLDQTVGGYGSDHADRRFLIEIARRRAGDKYHSRFTGHASVVIGDTPADVAATRAAGAAVIAVASGYTDIAELGASRPDAVFESLPDAETWFRVITGVGR